jgi:hypothetical protein
VKEATGGAQIPWQNSSLESEVFLAGEAATSAPTTPVADPAEVAFWNSIQGSATAADFADYVRRYPQGTYVTLARRRFETLSVRAKELPTASVVPASSPASRIVAAPPSVDSRSLGTWLKVETGHTSDLSAVWVGGPRNVFTFAPSFINHWSGAGWSTTRSERKATLAGTKDCEEVEFNGWRAWGSTSTGLIAVADYECDDFPDFIRWDGRQWRDGVANVGYWTTSIDAWGSSPSDVWIVDKGSRVAHFDGKSWRKVEPGVNARPRRVWGSGPNDVWLWGPAEVGLSGTHDEKLPWARWDGAKWSTPPAPCASLRTEETCWYTDMWGSGPDDVWLSGEFRKDNARPAIFHWDGRGWSLAFAGAAGAAGQTASISALWGSGPNDVWAVGGATKKDPLGAEVKSGLILHWDGITWTAVESGTEHYLNDIAGSGPSDIWIVGSDGTVLRYKSRR